LILFFRKLVPIDAPRDVHNYRKNKKKPDAPNKNRVVLGVQRDIENNVQSRKERAQKKRNRASPSLRAAIRLGSRRPTMVTSSETRIA